MIEYELLKIIWWVLVGVLLIGFALTDGFDMGSMAIMPFVGKTGRRTSCSHQHYRSALGR